jgi:hypothetical protein
MLLPIGWLPLGVTAASEGNMIPAVLGLLGMTLIGSYSLWRAYRTTMGLYQGQFTGHGAPAARAAESPKSAQRSAKLLLEARLPGLSETVSAVALAGFRSLVRAPEAKMMLLTPLIMIPIFGSMLWNGRHGIPEAMRPLVAVGGMLLVLFGVMQLMSNQFGFDRDGFRVFVLSAAPRRDILFGKNLVFAPLALGLGAIMLAIVQTVCPMRPDHVLAMCAQYVSMFLIFCIFANFLSIYTPLHFAAGSLKPSNPKLGTVLLQLLMMLVVFPLMQVPTLLPLGIEAMLRFMGWTGGAPIYLLLSLLECAVIVILFRFALEWQGHLLQSQEQRILEIVTNRAS